MLAPPASSLGAKCLLFAARATRSLTKQSNGPGQKGGKPRQYREFARDHNPRVGGRVPPLAWLIGCGCADFGGLRLWQSTRKAGPPSRPKTCPLLPVSSHVVRQPRHLHVCRLPRVAPLRQILLAAPDRGRGFRALTEQSNDSARPVVANRCEDRCPCLRSAASVHSGRRQSPAGKHASAAG
jgi:hypothetical protein